MLHYVSTIINKLETVQRSNELYNIFMRARTKRIETGGMTEHE